mgnify:CR=1 FL=1
MKLKRSVKFIIPVVSFAFVVVAAVVTLTVAGSVLSSYIVPLVAADEEENPVPLWLPST